jgi:hypothetical protein
MDEQREKALQDKSQLSGLSDSEADELGRLLAAKRGRLYGERSMVQPGTSEPYCVVCGQQPAELIFLTRNVGMLFARRRYEFNRVLCRTHGIRFAWSWLAKTLVQGWWGTISFFVNFGCVGTDISALIQALRIRRPQPREAAPTPPDAAHGTAFSDPPG